MIGRSWRSVAPPALAALTVAALGAFPAYQDHQDAASRSDSATTRMSELQSTAGVLTPLAAGADHLQQELIELDLLVPEHHGVPEFVVELDAITDLLGIELRDVVPAPEAVEQSDAGTPGGWTSVEISVRIVGEYHDFVLFAEALTTTDRLAVIDAIAITASGDDTLVGDFRIRIFTNDQPPGALIARYVEEAGS